MKKNASEGLIPNRVIFWLTIAVIVYAVFNAVKDDNNSADKKKKKAEQEQSATAEVPKTPHVVTAEHNHLILKTQNAQPALQPSAQQQAATSSPIPMPPPGSSAPETSSGEGHSMVERMVARYLAPTLQKSVETQIDARMEQLHRQKKLMAANPKSQRMELKTFDNIIGKGNIIRQGSVVEFDITLWYFDGLEVMPKRTVTIIEGHSQIYEGVEQGLIGMKEGGTRTLIIPVHLLTSRNDNVLGAVTFYPETGLLAEVEVKDVK
ncbi:MAG: FKBP-type peptidyl-prolyl cis-trans isomerase [Alphaproteobacteria bacterium]|nr:FKBP-type peptidyl-prolyl cis-trans isomerase [Alphaproteobacteria bacterium]